MSKGYGLVNPTLDPAEEAARTVAILRYLQDTRGRRCKECDALLCGHEALMSLVLGFKDAPRCCTCLAQAHGRNRAEMGDHLLGFVASHRCHHAGWVWANREEGFDPAALPHCLWPTNPAAAPKYRPGVKEDGSALAQSAKRADDEWDAGDLGCGDLVLHLRLRLQTMKSGQLIKLTAQDPGAREDLPAWCRMTGHTLIMAKHPTYWIKRKEQ
jgi:tRNA 2-thiouridine synthesizing protein A